MDLGADKPDTSGAYIQAGTPTTEAGSRHLTGRGPVQETPKGDPVRPAHPTDSASITPRLYDGLA